jgi:ABC-type branched-subunit amino acid transport system ATPase component
MAKVALCGLTRRYGDVAAVDGVDLVVEHGQLACLLGPSGCGKTTTLRLIAGFVEPSGGEIRVGERLVSSPGRSLMPRILDGRCDQGRPMIARDRMINRAEARTSLVPTPSRLTPCA